MRQIRYLKYPIERLTREPGHHFFGYYDLQPWSGDGLYHLVHRVAFMDRLPAASDRAELGMIRMGDGHFITLADTYAWNFQQGAMLQWHPRNPTREILYNGFFQGGFKGVVRNIENGASRQLPCALANVSADGRYGLGINFSRLHGFRPGYGYAGVSDPFAAAEAPEEDGIRLVDLEAGTDRLVLSLARLGDLMNDKFGTSPRKLLVNHITFNPSGTRFLFLARNMPMPGKAQDGWVTLAATADRDGGNLHVLGNHAAASHYIWRDDRRLLIYADMAGPARMNLALVEDQSDRYEILDPAFFAFDGHCSYSPDGRFILYDSYPDAEGYRKLLLYDLHRREGLLLAELLSQIWAEMPSIDIRCDLHPRWSRDGKAISFDSIHEGHRHIYWMALEDGL